MSLARFLAMTCSLATVVAIGVTVTLSHWTPVEEAGSANQSAASKRVIRHISEAPSRPIPSENSFTDDLHWDPTVTEVLFADEPKQLVISLRSGNGQDAVTGPVNKALIDSKLRIAITDASVVPSGTRGTLTVFIESKEAVKAAGVWEELVIVGTNNLIHNNVLDEALASLKQGMNRISVSWQSDPAANLLMSNELKLGVDSRGPVLVGSPFLTGDPGSEVFLVLDFEQPDLESTTAGAHTNYIIERLQQSGSYVSLGQPASPSDVSITGDQRVQIKLSNLTTGTYRVTLTETITDKLGNQVEGAPLQRMFSSLPEPEKGQRIEFPEFLPTLRQPDVERKINPGDRVETTLVRLFYSRDAHRIAQIVNRTVRSFNRAAVTQSRRRAEDARDQADSLTDERRSKEREAVRVAENLRRVEQQLEQARKAERNIADIDKQISAKTAEIDRLKAEYGITEEVEGQPAEQLQAEPVSTGDLIPPAPEAGEPTSFRLRKLPIVPVNYFQNDPTELEEAKARIAQLQKDIDELEGQKTRLETLTDVKSLPQLEQEAAILRDAAARTNEESLQAQAKEDRAREKQFRLEVAAAHEDPDTYAAAKTDSIDPVAQVSVSVIGEGLIQLRGPRKGIDKIRTMVHQMDAPVGQVKVEVVTVQLNGERGNRMERPLGRIEAHLGLGRFLTSQSLMMLRQSIQEVATEIAMTNDQGNHYQVDRDRKYLYNFFGRDFIDELYEMDSEFLRTENKLLSLHSMDIVSQHQAFFVLALARNDVRHMILERFMGKVRSDLVQAEFDYRRSAELYPHKTRCWLPHQDRSCRECCNLEGVTYNNHQRYHFRNLLTFFGQLECSSTAASGDTMSPLQREFIRLAQIFKARLINEMELKQRVIERTLIEDERETDLIAEEQARNSIRNDVLEATRQIQKKRFSTSSTVNQANLDFALIVEEAIATAEQATDELARYREREKDLARLISSSKSDDSDQPRKMMSPQQKTQVISELYNSAVRVEQESLKLSQAVDALWRITPRTKAPIDSSKLYTELRGKLDSNDLLRDVDIAKLKAQGDLDTTVTLLNAYEFVDMQTQENIRDLSEYTKNYYAMLRELSDLFIMNSRLDSFDFPKAHAAYRQLEKLFKSLPAENENLNLLVDSARKVYDSIQQYDQANSLLESNQLFLTETRRTLEQRKLLDFLIEEQEEKVIDMLEGTRAQIATVDNYLKRLAIALEDDFKLQFYDPAFVRIRKAAREWDVTLSQVERTSVLTNNRAFAKVTPQATMEFDLPKRNIAVVEALDGAKALVDDYGNLLQDPTFLAAAQLQGLHVPNGQVQNVVPGLPSSLDEHQMGITPKTDSQSGSALQSLVPDPSVYKFETGTGYEIRPVIQPDGHSIIYDFNYMYTTNVREPVRADEKHLGRVKRHFIDTQVQTSSYELREVSRYQVGLKAARTSQGVPLLQDIPVLGVAFRPLPSAESSIQQNIILASTVVYPTLYDLMGLRWAPSIVDLNHIGVRDSEHVVRGRNTSVADSVFEHTTRRVDEIMGTERSTPEHYRPDLYHRNRKPSPYHPGGYIYEKVPVHADPTGSGFETPDERPMEFRQPPYDRKYRRPIRYEEVPQNLPQAEIIELSQPLELVPASQ